MVKACDETANVAVVCDKTSIRTVAYKADTKCKEEDKESKLNKVALEFDKCFKTGDSYTKASMTGAKALMASATIALAFVGSQF